MVPCSSCSEIFDTAQLPAADSHLMPSYKSYKDPLDKGPAEQNLHQTQKNKIYIFWNHCTLFCFYLATKEKLEDTPVN